MRSIGAFCLSVGLGLSVVGCGSGQDGGSSPSPDSAFAARFESAAAISDEAQRNKDFANVATDAAGAGDVDAARKSLLRIQNDSLRDSTAYKSALLLVKAGQKRAASSLVKTIKDNALQQKLTAKIAKGETSE
jgi:Tfp pilus assembly protein PilF